MPNIMSAKKRVRLTKRQTLRNKMIKSNLKTVLKNAQVALEQGAENSAEAVNLAVKKLDQAVSKGIIHKNKAARKKSQLTKKLAAKK